MELWIVGAVIFVWLIVVSFFLFRSARHYNKFLGGGRRGDLAKLVEEIVNKIKLGEKDRRELADRISSLEVDGRYHIQKVGLLRYNPFSDTGGDQSFVLALLDQADTGIVISSLHTRGGTRWYAKKLKKGKPEQYNLSNEEEKAIKLARKQTKKSK